MALWGIVSTTKRFSKEAKKAVGDQAIILTPHDIWEQFTDTIHINLASAG